MESLTLNNDVLLKSWCQRLAGGRVNVARPVRIGPIDLLSIWDGKVIQRIQVKRCYKRSLDTNIRYQFTVAQAGKNYTKNELDFLILVGGGRNQKFLGHSIQENW